MILPDVNILMHAYNTGSPLHARARAWLEGALSASELVGFAWATVLAYVRLMTNARIVNAPLSVGAAEADVRTWLARPNAVVVHPTERHADLLFGFLRAAGAAGNLTTDAHLAALAVEHQAHVVTCDADFSRFPGVRHSNPLA